MLTEKPLRVGGVVSESSFKFFIQFLFYALLFTTFNLVVFAIFVAERREEVCFLSSTVSGFVVMTVISFNA